jgi:hypothetical protein
MAIGRKSGTIGRTAQRVGSVGKQGKKAGMIGKNKKIYGSALTTDQNRTKVLYPTTTTAAP